MCITFSSQKTGQEEEEEEAINNFYYELRRNLISIFLNNNLDIHVCRLQLTDLQMLQCIYSCLSFLEVMPAYILGVDDVHKLTNKSSYRRMILTVKYCLQGEALCVPRVILM